MPKASMRLVLLTISEAWHTYLKLVTRRMWSKFMCCLFEVHVKQPGNHKLFRALIIWCFSCICNCVLYSGCRLCSTMMHSWRNVSDSAHFYGRRFWRCVIAELVSSVLYASDIKLMNGGNRLLANKVCHFAHYHYCLLIHWLCSLQKVDKLKFICLKYATATQWLIPAIFRQNNHLQQSGPTDKKLKKGYKERRGRLEYPLQARQAAGDSNFKLTIGWLLCIFLDVHAFSTIPHVEVAARDDGSTH